MTNVVVLIGAGSIGLAIARRVGSGKRIVVADISADTASAVAEVLRDAGFDASVAQVDVGSRESVAALVAMSTELGEVTEVIHAAGLSPSQASVTDILRVDLYGTALVLELFGEVIAPGGSGVVISSQSGHRMPALTIEQDRALATAATEDLLSLDITTGITDTLRAYQISKRGNGLRVRAQAIVWGDRGARVNAISPGVIITPLARDELTGPRAAFYQRMLGGSPAGRAGTPDEVANVAELLMTPRGAFVTGSDILMDGGVTASYFYGPLAEGS